MRLWRFILIVLLILLIFTLGTLWNNPYSVFYRYRALDRDELVKKVLSENEQKYQQLLQSLELDEPIYKANTSASQYNKTLVVGIITVNRKYKSKVLGYLTQSVASVYKSVREESVEIFICNTDAMPSEHSEAVKISKKFATYNRFSTARISENGFQKEKEDYMFCVEKLLQHHSKYILVLEDDAVAIPNFFVELKTLIIPKLNYYYPDWGYVKLYYPPKWQGYANEWQRLSDLIYTAGLGSIGLTFIYVISGICISVCQHNLTINMLKFSHPLKRQKLLLILFSGFLASLVFVVVIGRQNVLEIQRVFHHYSILSAPSCCTPSILYKPGSAAEMVKSFRNVKCSIKYPFDIAQEDFRKNKSIGAYLIEPSLFRHIGLVSAIQGKGLKSDLKEFLT